MRKDVLFLSLTYAVLVLFVNYLILSLHWSVTSRVIILTLCDFVFLSVVSQGRLALLGSLSMIKKLAGYLPPSREVSLEKTLKRRATSANKTSKEKHDD
ncbi:hypothetical phage protein [Citrobacter phage CR8]|uniref:Hypothetical phage protein n=1 Tax=Citrobacter phage CR8 TaxID=1455076 RepID=W6PP55_9CAUD|nr:hypothetical protein CF79_gp25 [Citrobacter phage CR8]CDM21609.1 hypothetical phage protein [Citrobacter phage CR8]